MITIEYFDEYGQRYITSSKPVTLGTEFTTEVYTPYVYGHETLTRKLDDSIEIFGIITTTTQVFNKTGELIAEGTTFESNWIEVWKKCWVKPDNCFKYNLNCGTIDTIECEITSGPAFIRPSNTNNVVWADIASDGSFLPPGLNEVNLRIIDVWS